MKFVGADLHKKTISFCVVVIVDRKTQILRRRRFYCCDVGGIRRFLKDLGSFEVTVEATIGYDWFAALAEEYAQRVAIAHAGKLRVIAESTRKTDKIDAKILAEFLAHDMIPEAWRPTPRVRQHRSLVRRRFKVQSRITSIKNTMRGILTRYNADRSDLFTRIGQAATAKLQLLEEEEWLMSQLWEDLASAQKSLEQVNQRLVHFAKKATVQEREARAILETLPGAGPVTINTILAELGDWQRFRRGDAVVAFAGLDPGVRESDGRRRDLKITKAGSPLLRWIMIQLAHRLKRTTARWQSKFNRLSHRIGAKKATCAIARQLLLVIYAMLRDGKCYQFGAAA